MSEAPTPNESTPLVKHFELETPTGNEPSVQEDRDRQSKWSKPARNLFYLTSAISVLLFGVLTLTSNYSTNVASSGEMRNGSDIIHDSNALSNGLWSSPLSIKSPVDDLNILSISRSYDSMPGPVLQNAKKIHPVMPTNSWCESMFLGDGYDETNRIYQIPYVVDVAGQIPGVRSNPARIISDSREVMIIFEQSAGLTLGGAENFVRQHQLVAKKSQAICRLTLALEWTATGTLYDYSTADESLENLPLPPSVKPVGTMQAIIARGSPYSSMMYYNTTPRVYVQQQSLRYAPIIDGRSNTSHTLICGEGLGVFTETPVSVQRYLEVQFHPSDMTWVIFFSEPVEVVCSNYFDPEAASTRSSFELKTVKPMKRGMVRAALVNNCTVGTNFQFCDQGKKRNQDAYTNLIIEHADVYPTDEADVDFIFPGDVGQSSEIAEGKFHLNFNWNPRLMSDLRYEPERHVNSIVNLEIPRYQLLTFGVAHHLSNLVPIVGSSNQVLRNVGCTPTLHGLACPVAGNTWALSETLHPVSFYADKAPRKEMLPDIYASLANDLLFELPHYYMRGAGDTYFPGKMLAKLARILVIAEEVGGYAPSEGKTKMSAKDKKNEKLFSDALGRLRSGVQVWLNGSAVTQLLYDPAWGGLVNCGCFFNGEQQTCDNHYPDCPALGDMGQNFGLGFYNDHHFHYGYHIYAAAVLAYFDNDWGVEFFEKVLLYIRDIANPSLEDPYFPTWRHKDWYLGFSWASGIVNSGGRPNPNGRNQESSSEAIAAYEGVALYGQVMAKVFQNKLSDSPAEMEKNTNIALRIRDNGRILMATEIRSAQAYYHVQSRETAPAIRVYPDNYVPKVVGMMWTMMALEQTWFGNRPWTSVGIQLLPLTPIVTVRDTKAWVKEMIPSFNQSCHESPDCAQFGWSILVHAHMATAGHWRTAWSNLQKLPDDAFVAAGGNGHSRTNTLWFIMTR